MTRNFSDTLFNETVAKEVHPYEGMYYLISALILIDVFDELMIGILRRMSRRGKD